jgi:hypothetical protein
MEVVIETDRLSEKVDCRRCVFYHVYSRVTLE